MSLLVSITEGWTQRLGPFTLRVDGEPLNLTGFDVVLKLRGRNGALLDTTDQVTVDPDQDENPGQVFWDPNAADPIERHSRYTLHFQVTDADGKVVYFPNGEPDEIQVYRP